MEVLAGYMYEANVRSLLEEVRAGRLAVDAAVERLRFLPYEELGFAKIDHHRVIRKGFPEVVFCLGKTPAQVQSICQRLAADNPIVLATRADEKKYQAVREVLPQAKYYPEARIILVGEEPTPSYPGRIAVLTAGTADVPVAEEAAVTAWAMGHRVDRIYDVGVAGLHRLLSRREELRGANVLIVVAGMEGALASVVGGLVDKPIIAVPTSIGYGAHLDGLAPLLTMLNSCASGVAVVNIDNGFGAGYMAAIINRLAAGGGSEKEHGG